jgi:hypothetical protein
VEPLEELLHEPLEAHSASFAEAASGVSSQTILCSLPLQEFHLKPFCAPYLVSTDDDATAPVLSVLFSMFFFSVDVPPIYI